MILFCGYSLLFHELYYTISVHSQVTSGIYVAIGYALANSILIEAPEGNIIVDTTETLVSAEKIREAFRNVSERPIKAIIYTHNHPDHTFGASVSFFPNVLSKKTLENAMFSGEKICFVLFTSVKGKHFTRQIFKEKSPG